MSGKQGKPKKGKKAETKEDTDWKQLDLRYPLDDDGYAQSFPDPSTWLEVMQRYNVLVAPILTLEECEELQADMWRVVGPKVTPDPFTWETENWPHPDHPLLLNQHVATLQAFLVRSHPRLVQVFQHLYSTDDVLTTIDHYGFKRATVLTNGVVREDWRTKPLLLHWDTDILQYLEDAKPRYQALIAANDNPEEVGGFSCVVGSANLLESWARANIQLTPAELKKLSPAQRKARLKYVPAPNPWQRTVQKLPLRQGHVEIWDTGVAHSNFPNFSVQPRLTMYVRMVPRTQLAQEREKQVITSHWVENPKQRQEVSGMHPWTPEQRRVLGLF
jgi:ectoine hydroxylase-related dioxygenase (phytanoyl-CoA dioxygenase family)